jgi:hypothetical protein
VYICRNKTIYMKGCRGTELSPHTPLTTGHSPWLKFTVLFLSDNKKRTQYLKQTTTPPAEYLTNSLFVFSNQTSWCIHGTMSKVWQSGERQLVIDRVKLLRFTIQLDISGYTAIISTLHIQLYFKTKHVFFYQQRVLLDWIVIFFISEFICSYSKL